MHNHRYTTARNMRAPPVRPAAHHSQLVQVRPPGVYISHDRPMNQQRNTITTQNNRHLPHEPRHQHRAAPFGRAGATVRFGTYNTRTLRNHGEAEQLASDLAVAGIHICGLQEVRQRGSGQRTISNTTSTEGNPADGWQLIWSGHDTQRRSGVGALLAPAATRALVGWASLGDRLMTLQFAGPIVTTVVVAYAPTNPSAEADKNSFYRLLGDTLAKIPAHHITVVLGDMNAKVGRDTDSWQGIIGGFGTPRAPGPPWAAMAAQAANLNAVVQADAANAQRNRHSNDSSSSDSSNDPSPPPSPMSAVPSPPPAPIPPNHLQAHRPRNHRPPAVANNNGRRCLQMCAANGLLVANTFFSHRDEHTASWLSNTGAHWATLDLILVSRRVRSSIIDTRVMSAATAHHSDHRLVFCDMRLKLKARPRGEAPTRVRFDTAAVQPDSILHQQYKNAIATAYVTHTASAPDQPTDSEAEWAAMLQGMNVAAAQKIPQQPRQNRRRAQWITDATISICEQKREAFKLWQNLLSNHPSPAPHNVHHPTASAHTAYKQLNTQAKAAARHDKNASLQQCAQEMEDHMSAGRTHAAFRIAAQLRGCSRQQQVQAIKTPAGQLAVGSQVVQVLAQHFHNTLNVGTRVDPNLLAQIPPYPHIPLQPQVLQQPQPTSDITAAATATSTAQPPHTHPSRPSGAAAASRAVRASATRLAAAAITASQHAAATAEQASNGDEPTEIEVETAIKSLRNTAPGADGLTSALLKLGGRAAAAWLHRIIKAIWRSGSAPVAWKRALLVAIHKSGSRLLCDHYRGVTLLEVCGKVYVSVIHSRIHGHLCSQLLDAQQGFRPGRGTGDALFCMRRLQELARDFNIPLHGAFVDFRKAFDSINREALWLLLLARGVAPKLVSLMQDLYSGCAAQVVANGHTSDYFPMASGVRQGCPMSPTLFNVFMDFLARLVTQRCQAQGVSGFGVAFRINRQLVPLPSIGDTDMAMLMLLYADDMVLLADSSAGLLKALLILEQTAGEWGMALNYDKTKVVVFGSGDQQQQHQQEQQQQQQQQPAVGRQQQAAEVFTTLHQGQVKHVDHFRYLGSVVAASGQQERELCRRQQLAGVAFHQLRHKVFDIRGITLKTKMKMYKAVVVPTLLYGGAESWAPTQAQLQSLDACNTTWLRRMLHIRRGPHMMSNAQLHALTKQLPISDLLCRHRLRWLGHAARMPDNSSVKRLLHATAPSPAIDGEVGQQLRRGMGGPRATWNRVALDNVRTHGIEHSWHTDCQDRDRWRRIANRDIT